MRFGIKVILVYFSILVPSWGIHKKNIWHFSTSVIYLKSDCLFGKDILNKLPVESYGSVWALGGRLLTQHRKMDYLN